MPYAEPVTKYLVGASLDYNRPSNHFVVRADISAAAATWGTVASHEYATVTGLVRVRVLVECVETLTDAADLATIQLGVEGTTNSWIAATPAAGFTAISIATGEIWFDATPTEKEGNTTTLLFDKIVNGLDLGYEVAGEALTGGKLDFHVWWEPLNSTGLVDAGAGGSL